MKAEGAHYEIIVDSKPRSYRDQKEMAIAAGKYLRNGTRPLK